MYCIVYFIQVHCLFVIYIFSLYKKIHMTVSMVEFLDDEEKKAGAMKLS